METEGHVRDLLTTPDQIDAFVALDPEAAFALCEAGRSYLKLEDGYAETSLRGLAEQALDDQQRWAQWVDCCLQERCPAFRTAGFWPAALYLSWLKIVFDSVSIRAHTVDWALRRWNPSRLIYPGHEDANRTFAWDLHYRESLYPAVLRRVAARLGIEAALPVEPAAASVRADADARPWWTAQRSLPRRMVQSVRARFRAAQIGRSPRCADLIAAANYDLATVCRMAVHERVQFTPWEALVDRFRPHVTAAAADEANRWMAEAWNALNARQEFRCVARPAGYDFWTTAEPRLRFWWHVLVPQQWAVHLAVRRSFADHPPRTVALAVLGDHVERGIFGALKSLGANTFLYQHGGFVGWCECPPWDCSDLWHAQFELTYGRGATEYFDSRRMRYGGKRAASISVGSSRLDELRRQFASVRRRRRARPRVLLVPNVIPRYSRYLDCGTLPDVTEAEVQAAMVSLAREFPACDFVLKPFPEQFDTPAVRLARRPQSNCVVDERATLTSLMLEADLIVLSFPSTALLEALVTDRPVIVFADGRSIEMFPEAKAALSTRAVVAETVGDFLVAIHSALERKAFGPISDPDQTFLEMYGTHLNDGVSARRAIDAIAHGPIAE